MPKYLITGSYTSEGAKGVLAKGGSDRRAAVEKLAESVGGTVDAFYFAFGGDDIVTIIDAPDNEAVAAVSMTVAMTSANIFLRFIFIRFHPPFSAANPPYCYFATG